MSLFFLFVVAIHLFQTTVAVVNIISPYNGKTLTGITGSSIHFNWSFSGALQIQWGLKASGGNFIDPKGLLLSIAYYGQVTSSAPSMYSARVSGSGSAASGKAAFTLNNITKEDERFFVCKIIPLSGDDAEVFDTVQLEVKVPPDIVYISGNQTANVGDKVTLICNATGYPTPSITWTRLSDNSVVNMPLSIGKQDTGGYKCMATNSIGNPVSKDVFITVQYKPVNTTITTSMAQNTAIQGQNVTFTCDVADASPPVSEYRFYFNDSIKAMKTLQNTNKFTIYNVQRERFGKYKCVAENDAGEDHSNSVFLNINVPARVKSLTKNITVNLTYPINLRCEVTGYPAPSITWQKGGEKVHSGSGVFHIKSSKRIDSGAYVCIADNDVGTSEMQTFVTVHYPASITSTAPITSTKSWIGERVTLKCVTDGVPIPTITWQKPDGSETAPVIAKESPLSLEMKVDRDFGNYTCKAYNDVGAAATRIVQVKQIKAPSSPSITSTAADIKATSMTVKWTAPADDGGSSITAYRVVITQGSTEKRNQNVTDPNTKELTIGNLDKDTNYAVKVYARNYVFEGNASLKIIKTDYEGVPAAAEIIGLPPSTKKVEVTIKWDQPLDNGDPITKYTVYQRTTKDNGSLGDWNKLYEINDPLEREAILQLVTGKEYEFVVTATNKFGESLKEEGKIKKIVVLGEAPAAVNFTATEEDGIISLKWKEPENNGAAITKYLIYQRFVNDKEWNKLEDITDTSKQEYVLKGEEGKEYEFVVTATNKYGESSKTANIQKVKVLKGTGTDRQEEESGGMNMAVIAGAAAAGVLLILALIIFGIWWKRRKTPSEHGSSVADLSGRNPDDFDDGYHAVGAAAAAHQLQASGRAAEATYAQVDMSQKKNRRPVTDLYAEVDKSKKTKKKGQKQPGELDYAELDDLRPNFQPASQPPGAAVRPLVRAPAYEGTEYADITQFGVPQPEPTYDNVPKKDVVYSNVESM